MSGSSPMKLRDHILIQKNAIPPADLEALARYVQQAPMEQTAVSNLAEDAPEEGVEWVVNKDVRDTHHLHQTTTIVRKLRSITKAGVGSFVEPFYNVKIRDWEPLQLLTTAKAVITFRMWMRRRSTPTRTVWSCGRKRWIETSRWSIS